MPLPEISDHCAILTTMKLTITYQKSVGHKVYLWKQANLQEMKKVWWSFPLNLHKIILLKHL